MNQHYRIYDRVRLRVNPPETDRISFFKNECVRLALRNLFSIASIVP